MDRTQAFIEYGRILEDAQDWLDAGYRKTHPPAAVTPPSLSTASSRPPYGNGRTEGTRDIATDDTNAVDSRTSAAPNEYEPNQVIETERTATLLEIADEVASCQKCNLHLIRENTVPGIGRTDVVLMVVTPPPTDGAAPDMNPLAPYESEYLGKWLTALGLDPLRDIFITPAVKCRTPGGRPPKAEESAACAGYLRRQYKAVKPRAILALGAAACSALTGDDADFPALVARDWTWGSVPALVLWAPAEVLANPGKLRKPVWDALQRLKVSWNAVPRTGL